MKHFSLLDIHQSILSHFFFVKICQIRRHFTILADI
ncbi:unnamed protein product, partial [Brugia timori]|uniref:Uncharacterized protein n=1 Tax=Brugia timori TaxID=42155 RepID=A0A0R3R9S1_9BILA